MSRQTRVPTQSSLKTPVKGMFRLMLRCVKVIHLLLMSFCFRTVMR